MWDFFNCTDNFYWMPIKEVHVRMTENDSLY